MRSVVSSVMKCLGLLLCCVSAANAQENQVIEIVGARIAPVTITLIFTPAPEIYPQSQNQITMISQMNQVARIIRDVRCVATGGRERTTSHNDVLDRYFAAAEVYTAIQNTSVAIRGVILGSVKNPSDGKTYRGFQVTYADGGTEKWMVFPSPASSVKLLDTPYPDSLTRGDGVVKPSVCAVS
jgi:hypothetical protein